MFRRLVFAASLILSVSGAMACGSSSTAPVVATTSAQQYVSRIQERGSAWRSIVVPVAGDVTVQLVSVSQANAVMRLGVGTIDGTRCVLVKSIDTVANSTANSPQITGTMPQGTYCVQLADIGNLTTIVDFLIVIVTPL